jgi:hypothetical protein
MYIVTVFSINQNHPFYNSCSNHNYDVVMTTIDPTGNLTYQCLPNGGGIYNNGNNIALLNQEFNSIISQGYKLVLKDEESNITNTTTINGTWYFAIP